MMKCGVMFLGVIYLTVKRYLLKENVAIVVGAECRCSCRSLKILDISSLAHEYTFLY
jgi:hypothetical protein